MPAKQSDFLLKADIPLREQFAQALKVQGKKEMTIERYLEVMRKFSAFIDVPPLRARINHIRAFLFHLLREKNYAPRTYNVHMYAIVSFYKIFKPDVPIETICCRHKTDRRVVDVLDRTEIDDMIHVTRNIKHRALIQVLYGSGVRVSECCKIKFEDIDRKSMLLKVHGKGDKERFTIISKKALVTLAEYYREFKPDSCLFEGRNKNPLTISMVDIAIRNAAKKAGIKKK